MRDVLPFSLFFVGYFSTMLAPHFFPGVAMSFFYSFYLLAVFITIILLLITSLLSTTGLVMVRNSEGSLRSLCWRVLKIGAIGSLIFFLYFASDQVLCDGLPAGSRLRKFESSVWQDSRSTQYISDDYTPRQKMLRDVVRNVLPSRTRTEIEKQLGPGKPNGFFQERSYDMIYQTGPQRDSLFAIDSEWLLIWLNNEGRFQRSEITTD
jgi:hypothetical protein